MILIYAVLLIWLAFYWIGNLKLPFILLTLINGAMDILIPLLICNIIHESSKARLTCDTEGNVRFMRAERDSESSGEEEQTVEPDRELEEWLSDE